MIWGKGRALSFYYTLVMADKEKLLSTADSARNDFLKQQQQ